MPVSSEPVIPHQRRYSRSEELSRALSTQLSSNEGEQPVCRSRLIDNRKIEIFKAPALSGPFAYSHSVALSSVVRNASAMSPIGREADIRQNADVNPMHSLRQEAVSHAGRCWARTRSGAPGKSAPVTGRRRCRMHSGADGSGAPSGERNGNYKHGRYTGEVQATRRWLREATHMLLELNKRSR
jgi:hypothetical protein